LNLDGALIIGDCKAKEGNTEVNINTAGTRVGVDFAARARIVLEELNFAQSRGIRDGGEGRKEGLGNIRLHYWVWRRWEPYAFLVNDDCRS
jgi:hypothetical protein